jgi:hypothetical protein
MMQRGRKSSAKLATLMPLPGQRHEPPSDLTPEQAKVWRQVVATKPGDWFTADSHPLLAAYCRQVATVNLLSVQIDAFEGDAINVIDPKQLAAYDKLLLARTREVKSLVVLATAMRITQYSRLKPETAATQAINAGDASKPWNAVG